MLYTGINDRPDNYTYTYHLML